MLKALFDKVCSKIWKTKHSLPEANVAVAQAAQVKLEMSLAPTSVQFLDTLVQKLGTSRSGLIEGIASGCITISSNVADTVVSVKTNIDNTGRRSSPDIDLVDMKQQRNEVAESIDRNPSQEHQDSPQQSLAEPTQLVTALQQQVAKLQEQVENRTAEQLTQQCNALQKQLQNQESVVTNLHQQITQLESRIAIQTMQRDNNESLQQQIAEQATVITDLQQQIVHLQRLATIGETHLNKWRYRTFS
jgi:DNA repair exonuclease SbcCD ATPase subunit